jgi:hypothetical protein
VTHRCPGCGNQTRQQGMYLCLTCWNQLGPMTRLQLNWKDDGAMRRLQELYDQLAQGVPLAEIVVIP